MILGMSLGTFTALHVIICLIGLVAGLVVVFGMFGSRRLWLDCRLPDFQIGRAHV